MYQVQPHLLFVVVFNTGESRWVGRCSSAELKICCEAPYFIWYENGPPNPVTHPVTPEIYILFARTLQFEAVTHQVTSYKIQVTS